MELTPNLISSDSIAHIYQGIIRGHQSICSGSVLALLTMGSISNRDFYLCLIIAWPMPRLYRRCRRQTISKKQKKLSMFCIERSLVNKPRISVNIEGSRFWAKSAITKRLALSLWYMYKHAVVYYLPVSWVLMNSNKRMKLLFTLDKWKGEKHLASWFIEYVAMRTCTDLKFATNNSLTNKMLHNNVDCTPIF